MAIGPRSCSPRRSATRRHDGLGDATARADEGTAPGPVIPYDVAATFRIIGRPGNLLQDVINISTDGVFVAVAIGYGFEEDRERPLQEPTHWPRSPARRRSSSAISRFRNCRIAALVEGFRVNP